MLSIALIEDENDISAQMISYIEKYCSNNSIAVKTTRFEDAVSFLESYKPVYDIIFMDIVLPRLSGMAAAHKLREVDPTVILVFVTSMANYAVNGYEVNASDFMLKPVAYDLFSIKMKKIVQSALRNRGKAIPVSAGAKTTLIPLNTLYYVESNRHYLLYHTEEGVVRALGTLNEFEKQLEVDYFARCSVSYLVNLNYVTEINGDDITVGGDTLRISRAKKRDFLQYLANYFGRSSG